jgi:Na+-transporting NADH:ubiquinone oxidoreductase subunit NqrB
MAIIDSIRGLSNKSVKTVALEGVFVGLALVVVLYLVRKFLIPYVPAVVSQDKAVETAFISGMLFHILSEYTGLNLWYVKKYPRGV